VKRFAVVVLLLACAALATAQEASNPFTAKDGRPHAAQPGRGSYLSSVAFTVLGPVQKSLNESLTAVTRSLQGSRTAGGFLLVLLLSLAYGIFHAAGPGHGKTVVSSYFLANDARIRHGIIVGNFIAVVHALAALAVVLLLYFVIRGVFSTGVEQANRYIQIASFGLIAALGAFVLVQRIRGIVHHHGHEGGQPREVSLRGLIAVAVPAGMIPCPGAVAVILFALSLNMLWVSVLSVVSMSIGMGLTISFTALIVVVAKRGVIGAFSGGKPRRSALVRRILETGGAAILFLFGLLFFLAQL
jgi:ABC-type nickel/cobalt efflux system permease component RcnA